MKPNDKAIEAAAAEGGKWDTSDLGGWKVLREDDIKAGWDIIERFDNREERDEALERLRAEAMITAAYAAQFQSEDYAGLVKQLRNWGAMNYQICDEAADAIEAVLAKRDELDKWLRESKQNFMRVDIERNNLRAERDALLARLAPVDDKALVGLDRSGIRHYSDCAVNNEPAFPAGECDCGGYTLEKEAMRLTKENLELLDKNAHLTEERDALLARLAPVDYEELVEIAADAISTYVRDQVSKWGSIKDAAIDAIAAIRPHIEAAERERCAKIADEMIYADEIAEEIRSGK